MSVWPRTAGGAAACTEAGAKTIPANSTGMRNLRTTTLPEGTQSMGQPEPSDLRHRPEPERKAGVAGLRAGELMRVGHAKPGRSARTRTAAHHPRSARALRARVHREAADRSAGVRPGGSDPGA